MYCLWTSNWIDFHWFQNGKGDRYYIITSLGTWKHLQCQLCEPRKEKHSSDSWCYNNDSLCFPVATCITKPSNKLKNRAYEKQKDKKKYIKKQVTCWIRALFWNIWSSCTETAWIKCSTLSKNTWWSRTITWVPPLIRRHF